jgi:Domain of unknown function (DUF1918)
MYAQAGDLLIVDGDTRRVGLIIQVPHTDGTPPYVVRWQATGHIAMVSPGEFARVIHPDDDSSAEIRPLAAAGSPRSQERVSATPVARARNRRTPDAAVVPADDAAHRDRESC